MDGLKQAPKASYERLSKFLLDQGYSKGKVNAKIFIKCQGKYILFIQIYVGDIIFDSTNM